MLGRLVTVVGVLCCLHVAQVFGTADGYRFNSSHFGFGEIEAHHLLLLGMLEGILGLSMILERQRSEVLSWIVVPAWILSLAWWALLFPRLSILQLIHHPYLACGWYTFFGGSAYFLTVFVIVRRWAAATRGRIRMQ
jgi:hypothetical protein